MSIFRDVYVPRFLFIFIVSGIRLANMQNKSKIIFRGQLKRSPLLKWRKQKYHKIVKVTKQRTRASDSKNIPALILNEFLVNIQGLCLV